MDNIPVDVRKSYVVSFNVSVVLNDIKDVGLDIYLLEEILEHMGFKVDNVEYEEIEYKE